MKMEVARTITFFFALGGLTFFLIWGIKKISLAMGDPKTKSSLLLNGILSESKPIPPLPSANGTVKGSFSRVSGAIGAISIAATFIGIGYWAIFALFFDPSNLENFKEMGTYFLAGSAMFMPYAFNQLSSIFTNT